MSIDPRLAERRKTVAEENAKKSIRRLLKFLLVLLTVGALVWLAFSPWLSVRLVRVEGVESSTTNSVLADLGVTAGTPMITIQPRVVQRALESDPWVAEARVNRHWPDVVDVEVTERRPVAWVRSDGGWARRAVDGVALPSDAEPDPTMVWIDLPVTDTPSGISAELAGALEFAAALPGALREGASVTLVDGELWATVSGFQVRLGRPVDMEAKALSLSALLARGVPEGSTVVLIAPTNPAVRTPGAGESATGQDGDDD